MRDKLIEIIRSVQYNDNGSTIGKTFQSRFVERIADHLIENGVTVATDNNAPSKWIPVTERLPQGADGKSLCKNVIAYTIDGQVVPGWLNGAYWYLLLQNDTAFTRLERDCVTHWMPLPEPPEVTV